MNSAFYAIFAVTGLVLIVTIAVTVGVIRYVGGRSRRSLSAIAEKTGGGISLKRSTMAAQLSGRLNGEAFSCSYTPAMKNTPPMFLVTIPEKQNFSVVFRKKNGWDSFCEKLGLAKPVESRDPDFGRRFWADTKDRRATEMLLASAEAREAIAAALLSPVKKLAVDPEGLSLVRVLGAKDLPTPGALEELLALAGPVSRSARRVKQGFSEPGPTDKALGFALGLPLVLGFFGGGVALMAGDAAFPPLFPSFFQVLRLALPFALGGYFLYAALAWAAVRSRSNRHVFFSIAVACAVLAAPLGAAGSVMLVNGLGDGSESQVTAGTVLRNIKGSKGARNVVFDVGGRESAVISRPRGCCTVGEPVTIEFREGRLGIPWIVQWGTGGGQRP